MGILRGQGALKPARMAVPRLRGAGAFWFYGMANMNLVPAVATAGHPPQPTASFPRKRMGV